MLCDGTLNGKNILFSDKKKMNLDGPDGNICYSNDLNENSREQYTHIGGGSITLGWCFLICRKMESTNCLWQNELGQLSPNVIRMRDTLPAEIAVPSPRHPSK